LPAYIASWPKQSTISLPASFPFSREIRFYLFARPSVPVPYFHFSRYQTQNKKKEKEKRKIEMSPTANENVATGGATHGTIGAGCPSSCPTFQPIAIVGMAIRLPGGVRSADDLWNFLIDKKDARSVVPKDRYNIDAFYSERGMPGSVNCKHGYFLQEDLGRWDAGLFSSSKLEAGSMDPQQRLLLEVVWECLESAGQTQWRGKDIGCFVGTFAEDWLNLMNRDPQLQDVHQLTGIGDWALANRVSYEFDFKGPSTTVKTACSSSSVALHQACQAIQMGECSAAVVGAANLILSPIISTSMSVIGILAPDGICKTFDDGANGYARGEAISAIYIKTLDAALRDNDPIRAVIRGSASNYDGKTSGLTYPSIASHEAMIRQAYQAAGIGSLSDTCFVQCHGTGTAVGDPVETTAIANAFGGKQDIFIGSVKPNFGHSEGASGLTNIMAAILALQHKVIPPNIHFEKPNRLIPFEDGKLRVALDPMPWPQGRPERVSVSSFGVGGSNVHLVLESAASFVRKEGCPRQLTGADQKKLLLFTANTADSLVKRVEAVRQYWETRLDCLHDLAYTLGDRREHLQYRTFSVARKHQWLEALPPCKSRLSPSSLIFVFTGQGAQWPGMGASLMEQFPSFREDIRGLDKILQALDRPPSWRLEEELSKDASSSRVYDTVLAHPLCTAVQLGLLNLLSQWNIRPSAVVGHSGGEIAAAYAADAITMNAAILIAFQRGQVSEQISLDGAMAAVALGKEEIMPYLVEGVVIACENSQHSTTISGDASAVDEAMAKIQMAHPEKLCRKLRVDRAYHSHHLKSVGGLYESLLSPSVVSTTPSIPFYSSVTGTLLSGSTALDARYWRQNYESPVLFNSAVEAILSSGSNRKVFVEIGPHSALAGPLRQIFQQGGAGSEAVYFPTVIRQEEARPCLLTTAGHLFLENVPINLIAINGQGKVLADIPSYPWDHDSSYWNESRLTRDWRLRRFGHHELLGARVPESTESEPLWRNVFRLENVPWIRDHSIGGKPTFPAASYVAIIGEAIRQITGCRSYIIRRLVIHAGLVVQDSNPTEIITTLRAGRLTDRQSSEWYDFTISSYEGSTWTKHCIGQARAAASTTPAGALETGPLGRRIQADAWYSGMAKLGLEYGPYFRGLERISTVPSGGKATACLKPGQEFPAEHYTVHPALIDQIFQVALVTQKGGAVRKMAKIPIPEMFEQIEIHPPENEELSFLVEASSRENAAGKLFAQVRAVSGSGLVVSVQQVRLFPLDVVNHLATDGLTISQLEWKPDIDFLPAQDLIHCVACMQERMLLAFKTAEKLSLLCILESAEKAKRVNTNDKFSPHLDKFRDWLDCESSRIRNGQSVIPDACELARLESPARLRLIRHTACQVLAADPKSEVRTLCEPIIRIFENCEGILHGSVDPLHVLMEGGCLTDLYTTMQAPWELKDYLASLSYSKPTLRVLEIGAGTGGTTQAVLKGLISPTGRRQYSVYTYTDVSAGFFEAARDRFQQYESVEFATLDISKDPHQQGFESEPYDLIIAANVLHATPSLQDTLRNVKKLLTPGGRLLLMEICSQIRMSNFIMGVLPGWWVGEADGRQEQPFVSPERWDGELKAAGFTGTDSVVYDNSPPFQVTAYMTSRNLSNDSHPKDVTLVVSVEHSSDAHNLEARLLESGYRVNRSTLDDIQNVEGVVIFLLDLEGPFFHSITPQKWIAFREYLSQATSSATIWVTRPSQMKCDDPRFSLVLGLARTVRQELAHDFVTFEVDTLDENACHALRQVYEKFQKQKQSNDMIEYEYSYINNSIHISRYEQFPAIEKLRSHSTESVYKSLDIEQYGALETLYWSEHKRRKPTAGQVEVELHFAGLSFKDIAESLGMIDQSDPTGRLGWEGAGIVTQVGPNVESLCVGDRVMVIEHGCFATSAVVSEQLCVRMPEKLSFEEAATMPIVYTTVIQSLLEIGHLKAGQSVLIHSACGGVGLAAVQVCQMMGSVIYATVGSDEKAEFLATTFRVPRRHIFNSRNTSFQRDLMKETDGKGADIVLNSLSGELLHASWQCVAEHGKFIELGKIDIESNGMLNLNMFRCNRAFIAVDNEHVVRQNPSEIRR
jgi:acyl transferase domain-containing protein/NADPH:quinone reductase-like Zn-dependent oxidoreductase